MSYNWRFSVLKRGEGGPGVADAVRVVKRDGGARAKKTESSYIGHEAIIVSANTKAEMRRAFFVLKQHGFIDSIHDAMQEIQQTQGAR